MEILQVGSRLIDMNCKVLHLATDVFEPCISEDRQTVRHCLSTSEDLTLIQRQAKEKSSQNLALRPDLSAVSKSSRHDATTAATPRKTLLSDHCPATQCHTV